MTQMSIAKIIYHLMVIISSVKASSEPVSRYIIDFVQEKSPIEQEENLAANLLSFFTSKLDSDYMNFKREFTDVQIASLGTLTMIEFIYKLNEFYFQMILKRLNEMSNHDFLQLPFSIPHDDPELQVLYCKFYTDLVNMNQTMPLDLLRYYHYYSLEHPDFFIEHVILIINRFILILHKNDKVFDFVCKILSFECNLQDVFEDKTHVINIKNLIKQQKIKLKFISFVDTVTDLNIEKLLNAAFELSRNDTKTDLIISFVMNYKSIVNAIFFKILHISQWQLMTENLLLDNILSIKSYLNQIYDHEKEKVAVINFKKRINRIRKRVLFEICENNYENCKNCLENILRHIYPDLENIDRIVHEVKKLCEMISNHFSKMISELNSR